MRRHRLRVLTIAPDLGFGGGENRVLNLARSIDRDRFDLTVATLYSRSGAMEATSGSLCDEFERAGVSVVDLKLPRPGKRAGTRALQRAGTTVTLARAAAQLRRAISEMDIDVVDAHMDGSLLLAAAASVAARVPVLATLYHVQTIPPNRAIQPLRRASMRALSAIITDSQARADDFAAALPMSHPPIHVIPNGVRLEAPGASREAVLRAFDIPPDAEMIIGQVSGLVPFKGHRVLLEAAKRVLAGRPKTYLLCAGFVRGAGTYVDRLRQQAQELGIADRVRLGPYDGQIADVWNVIDVHVHASLMDSLPNAILEGMSLGKPAVLTAVGGIPEAVAHGRTGLVVPPGDAGRLAEALLGVLNDRDLAERLGAAARARYAERYTPECCARAVERCFIHAVRDVGEGRRDQGRWQTT